MKCESCGSETETETLSRVQTEAYYDLKNAIAMEQDNEGQPRFDLHTGDQMVKYLYFNASSKAREAIKAAWKSKEAS